MEWKPIISKLEESRIAVKRVIELLLKTLWIRVVKRTKQPTIGRI